MRGVAAVSRPRTPARVWIAFVLTFAAAITSQIALDGAFTPPPVLPSVHWIRSPELMRRLALGYSAFWADIYWIRAVQYYGGTKLSKAEKKDYSLLYPLLDTTTTLDPRFNIAYRFGAILLSEGYPNGPGTVDDAVTLLKKAMREMPDKWQYLHDAGFVQYWWRRDTQEAAKWFLEASKKPDAPNWLGPLAASVLAEGGEREPARALWANLAANAEQDWMRAAARHGLAQLDAENHLELLQPIVNKFYDDYGRYPSSWVELVKARRLLRIPADPTGMAYVIDPVSGAVDLSPKSQLYPLRSRGKAR